VTAAGDGNIPAVGVHSDHAGLQYGTAHGCCDWPHEFADCNRRLQSLLFMCKRIGCSVVLGARDCSAIGDCLRAIAGIRLREAGHSAILILFSGAALDGALGSSGARGCAGCGQSWDRDWQQSLVLFYLTYLTPSTSPVTAGYFAGLLPLSSRPHDVYTPQPWIEYQPTTEQRVWRIQVVTYGCTAR
jgi:hypothetical protein